MLGILLYIAISVLMGCVSCFFGKRIYFPILMLTVFTYVVTAAFSLFEITWQVGLAASVVGIVAALLSVIFFKLGVFVLGGVLGASLGFLLAALLPEGTEGFHWIIALILAVILGVCALKWCWLFIMASTAYNGAVAIVIPLGFLIAEGRNLASFIYADGIFATMANLSSYLQGEFSTQYMTSLFVATLVVAAVGFVTQYRAEGQKLPEKHLLGESH